MNIEKTIQEVKKYIRRSFNTQWSEYCGEIEDIVPVTTCMLFDNIKDCRTVVISISNKHIYNDCATCDELWARITVSMYSDTGRLIGNHCIDNYCMAHELSGGTVVLRLSKLRRIINDVIIGKYVVPPVNIEEYVRY